MEEEVFEEFRKLDDLSRLLYFQSFSKKTGERKSQRDFVRFYAPRFFRSDFPLRNLPPKEDF